jgi:hypothetical protein
MRSACDYAASPVLQGYFIKGAALPPVVDFHPELTRVGA